MSVSENFIAAATVMIVRDGAAGLEVFMVVRHHEIDFASGALVFRLYSRILRGVRNFNGP